MGNFLTTERSRHSEELSELRNRLSNLENVDKDGDGIISKKEFEIWAKEQQNALKNFKEDIVLSEKQKYLEKLIDKDFEIKNLKKELKSLKRHNGKLFEEMKRSREKKLDKVTEVVDTSSKKSQSQETVEILSEEQIKIFVEELLTDENINIEYLPDWVERKLYINIFNILIGLIKKSAESTSINFIGHKINLDLIPQK